MTEVDQARSHRRNLIVGISYILLGMLFLSILSLISRYTSRRIPLSMILTFQGLIGWISILPWLYVHGLETLRTKRFGLIFLRTIFGGVGGFLLVFLAVQRTSLVNTMLLNNTGVIFAPFVFWIWRRAPINHLLWPGVLGGFVGIILILQPSKDVINPGALIALASGAMLSFNIVSNRILSYTERNHTVLFYYFGIATLTCLPVGLYLWVWPSFWDWLGIVAIGILTAAMQSLLFRAFHYAKAATLGPFLYSNVVYSVILDWAIYREIPNLMAWLGIAFVCAGGIWTILFNRSSS